MPDQIVDLTIPMLLPGEGDRFLLTLAFPNQSTRNNQLVEWLGPVYWSQLVKPYISGEINPKVMNRRLMELSGYYNQWIAHTNSTRKSLLRLTSYIHVE